MQVLDDPNVNKLYLVLEYMKKGDLVNLLMKKDRETPGNANTSGNGGGSGGATGGAATAVFAFSAGVRGGVGVGGRAVGRHQQGAQSRLPSEPDQSLPTTQHSLVVHIPAPHN